MTDDADRDTRRPDAPEEVPVLEDVIIPGELFAGDARLAKEVEEIAIEELWRARPEEDEQRLEALLEEIVEGTVQSVLDQMTAALKSSLRTQLRVMLPELLAAARNGHPGIKDSD